MHHVLELLPIRSGEQDPHTGTLLALGAIEEERLVRLGEDRRLWPPAHYHPGPLGCCWHS
jgi:hypothetical protein